jgi:hypothetical protein
MSFFFGDSTLQAPADLATAINFNPQKQVSGSGNYLTSATEQAQTTEQVASQTKKDEATASVGVGVGGGSGSGGTVNKGGDESSVTSQSGNLTKYIPYAIAGGVALIALFFLPKMFKKKGKK